ncbi:MAG: GDSL-type esterase/lipase family protein [Candidatus Omnitrophica bacterium]|nr:GDSL-type esterase/lipase family protein [Candidatus Omnitrophota bacterium]
MVTNKTIKDAIEKGRSQAKSVIAFRDRALKSRAAAIRNLPSPLPPRRAFKAPGVEDKAFASLRRSLGPMPRGVLVAEGDSWFDYPFFDILRCLEDLHGYDVESVAHKGDTVEEMAYGDGQLEEFTRRIEKVLRNGLVPRAILLSGGGNDIAGNEFGMLLNHAASSIAGLNRAVMDGVIDERLKVAYVTIISKVTSVCERRIGRTLPIVVHGYDYLVPDGRGFLGGWWLLPGPWLEPGFRVKGFKQLKERIDLATKLIDRFNEMLKEVSRIGSFGHVHYIDLRNTLSKKANYKADWCNELHPTRKGFEKVTDKFAGIIKTF